MAQMKEGGHFEGAEGGTEKFKELMKQAAAKFSDQFAEESAQVP